MEIKLTKGECVVIDKRDFELVKDIKWYVNEAGGLTYARGWNKELKKEVYMHQLLLGYPLEVDHLNKNGLDNRRKNIRSVTHKENMQNKKLYKSNTTGHKHIYWKKDREKYEVHIRHLGKFLGYFDNLDDAVLMLNEAI